MCRNKIKEKQMNATIKWLLLLQRTIVMTSYIPTSANDSKKFTRVQWVISTLELKAASIGVLCGFTGELCGLNGLNGLDE